QYTDRGTPDPLESAGRQRTSRLDTPQGWWPDPATVGRRRAPATRSIARSVLRDLGIPATSRPRACAAGDVQRIPADRESSRSAPGPAARSRCQVATRGTPSRPESDGYWQGAT